MDCYKEIMTDDLKDMKEEVRKSKSMTFFISALLVIGLIGIAIGVVMITAFGATSDVASIPIGIGYILTGIVPIIFGIGGMFKDRKSDGVSDCDGVTIILYILLIALFVAIAPFFTIKYLFDLRKQRKENEKFIAYYEEDLAELEAAGL